MKEIDNYNRIMAELKKCPASQVNKLASEAINIFSLLSNILGGSGMNSRLNLSLREKHGFVYSIGSQYIPFTDTGLFVISFGTEPGQLQKSIKLVNDELRKLCEQKLGVKQLAAAKEQIWGRQQWERKATSAS